MKEVVLGAMTSSMVATTATNSLVWAFITTVLAAYLMYDAVREEKDPD